MMYDCTTCTFSGRPPYKYPCSGCYKSSKWASKEKPITNADCIRAMNDDGLTEIFCGFLSNTFRLYGINAVLSDKFREDFNNWLKQPYKEKE